MKIVLITFLSSVSLPSGVIKKVKRQKTTKDLQAAWGSEIQGRPRHGMDASEV